MVRKSLLASVLASSALALALGSPAHADKHDRAKEAIAAAEAKIHTAESLGTAVEVPHETANARAALAMAKEELATGHKSASISAAIQAQALADTAIGQFQRHKNDAIAAANADAAAAQAARRDDVAAAQDQAAAAQQAAVQANARADAAQQAAASSAADAAAARNTAAAAVMTQTAPAQVETTTTTQQATGARGTTSRTHVVRHATSPVVPAPIAATTTTTTKITKP